MREPERRHWDIGEDSSGRVCGVDSGRELVVSTGVVNTVSLGVTIVESFIGGLEI